METNSGITEEQVKAGYRLNHVELKQASNWFKDRYIEIVSRQLVGLKIEDMAHISAAQEKAYVSIRNLCFSRKIAPYKNPEIFYRLTNFDQRICVKCMARLGEALPDFLTTGQPNRYWYNLWYAEANRDRVRERTRKYINSLPEEAKRLKTRHKMESTKRYLQTEKGKARSSEYLRNYRRRKGIEAGKMVRPYHTHRLSSRTAQKSRWEKLLGVFKRLYDALLG